MGRVGSCFDNAAAEAFFSSLEWKVLSRHEFDPTAKARAVAIDWRYGFYNTQRRHSAAAGQSPINYENAALNQDRGSGSPPRFRANHTTLQTAALLAVGTYVFIEGVGRLFEPAEIAATPVLVFGHRRPGRQRDRHRHPDQGRSQLERQHAGRVPRSETTRCCSRARRPAWTSSTSVSTCWAYRRAGCARASRLKDHQRAACADGARCGRGRPLPGRARAAGPGSVPGVSGRALRREHRAHDIPAGKPGARLTRACRTGVKLRRHRPSGGHGHRQMPTATASEVPGRHGAGASSDPPPHQGPSSASLLDDPASSACIRNAVVVTPNAG